jgi:HK97 family phage portal protein
MNSRGLLARALAPLIRAVEGAFRPGPYFLPITGGWLPEGAATNWWQMGYNPINGTERSAIVEACVSAYAQTVAMCPGDHWRANTKGGRDRVKNSGLARILRYPNSYQSISDFMLNLTRQLFLNGNAYALALRNSRFEVDELHLMDSRLSRPQLAETGDVFYHLGGNMIIERQLSGGALIVPQRDVLHVRLHATNRTWPWPLLGQSPLEAALADITMGDALLQQQINFYLNQARPSAVLSTDLVLDKEQVQALRDRWNEQVKGLGAGGTPILTAGLKVMPWGQAGKDAMIADIAKLSDSRIALVFRVPLQILGLGGTSYSSTELLMQSWIASGLGFALNHIEEAFGVLFQLDGQPDEYVEFSTKVLLRSALKDRIESLVRGVQGGIYAPNEARNEEELDSVKFGDEPRVQQQVVPLSAAAQIPATPGPPSPHAPPGSGAPALPPPPPKPMPGNREDVQREVRRILAAASRHGRRPSA